MTAVSRARAGALLLAACLLVAVVNGVVLPLVEFSRSSWDSHAAKVQRLNKLERIAGTEDEVRRELQRARERKAALIAFPGRSPATAANELLAAVQQAAQRGSVQISSLRPATTQSEDESIGVVSADVSIGATIESLTRFLTQLEHGDSPIWVGDFDIQVNPASAADLNPRLNVQLTVHAAWSRTP